MVNEKGLSTKAFLLMELRKHRGAPLSGTFLADAGNISRVAVWKGIQALTAAGYPIQTFEKGYILDSPEDNDFIYPWEFGQREALFRYFKNTGSTMDRAHEYAGQGLPGGTVIIAERQSAGRGRNGRTWASRQGGLFFTMLERPDLAASDYTLPGMMLQIALARVLSEICGKQAQLHWPNDVYIEERKIAGVMTEIAGEGDRLTWLSAGVGVNINNPVPSGKTISCSEITGHPVSRRDTLLKILAENKRITHRFSAGMDRRTLAAEWNSLAAFRGANAVLIAPGYGDYRKETALDRNARILARGIFAGIDGAGRCIIKSNDGKGHLYFSPGTGSLIFV